LGFGIWDCGFKSKDRRKGKDSGIADFISNDEIFLAL
jgi:hypothetical protein